MFRAVVCVFVAAVSASISACAEQRVLPETSQPGRVQPHTDISGTYDMQAVRWNGNKSTSKLLIRPLIDQIAWELIDLRHPRQNLALLRDDVLGIAFTTQSRPSDYTSYFGVAVYGIDGSTLEGEWLSSADPKTIGKERLYCPNGIPGQCTVLDGKSPGGKVDRIEMRPSDDGYWINWHEGGSANALFGVGIIQDNKLIVAFGRDIFPAIQVCRIGNASLACISSDGDLRYKNSVSLTRTPPPPS